MKDIETEALKSWLKSQNIDQTWKELSPLAVNLEAEFRQANGSTSGQTTNTSESL
jgi:hypothetical protein